MTVETNFRYISDLNPALPAVDDPIPEGDDHIRGVKNVLTSQFPNLGQSNVTATAQEIDASALRERGYGGMHRSQASQTVYVPAQPSYSPVFDAGSEVMASQNVTADPATGIITLNNTANIRRVSLSYAVSIYLSNPTMQPSAYPVGFFRTLVRRLSNNQVVDGSLMTGFMGDQLYDVGTNTVITYDAEAQPNEQYRIEINWTYGQARSVELLVYQFLASYES